MCSREGLAAGFARSNTGFDVADADPGHRRIPGGERCETHDDSAGPPKSVMASLHERCHGLTGIRFENPSRLRRREGGFWSMPEAVHHRGEWAVQKPGRAIR